MSKKDKALNIIRIIESYLRHNREAKISFVGGTPLFFGFDVLTPDGRHIHVDMNRNEEDFLRNLEAVLQLEFGQPQD